MTNFVKVKTTFFLPPLPFYWGFNHYWFFLYRSVVSLFSEIYFFPSLSRTYVWSLLSLSFKTPSLESLRRCISSCTCRSSSSLSLRILILLSTNLHDPSNLRHERVLWIFNILFSLHISLLLLFVLFFVISFSSFNASSFFIKVNDLLYSLIRLILHHVNTCLLLVYKSTVVFPCMTNYHDTVHSRYWSQFES